MFGFLKRFRAPAAPAPDVIAAGRAIDPESVFPEESWSGPACDGRMAVWRIETPAGTFHADAHAIEIVDGVLILLDSSDEVLGVLDPGQWDRVAGVGTGLPATVASARDAA